MEKTANFRTSVSGTLSENELLSDVLIARKRIQGIRKEALNLYAISDNDLTLRRLESQGDNKLCVKSSQHS